MDLDEVLAHHSGSLNLLAEAMNKASKTPDSPNKIQAVKETLGTLEDIIKQVKDRLPLEKIASLN